MDALRKCKTQPLPAVVENVIEIKPASGLMRRYLLFLASALVLGGSLLLIAFSFVSYDGGVTHDYFSEIAKEGDANWYRDFGGRHIPQI